MPLSAQAMRDVLVRVTGRQRRAGTGESRAAGRAGLALRHELPARRRQPARRELQRHRDRERGRRLGTRVLGQRTGRSRWSGSLSTAAAGGAALVSSSDTSAEKARVDARRRAPRPAARLAGRRRRPRARDAAGLVRQPRRARRRGASLRRRRRARRARAPDRRGDLRGGVVLLGCGRRRQRRGRPRGGAGARGRALCRRLRVARRCPAQRADRDGHRHRLAGVLCVGDAHARRSSRRCGASRWTK